MTSNIRAVVVDRSSPGRLAVREVTAPEPGVGDAVVEVAAFSLNRGETRMAVAQAGEGWRPGWDFAGTVVGESTAGPGPASGTRVVGLLPRGAWAERVCAPPSVLAPLPDGVSFAQAATLPVAGLTALHALGKGGLLLGRTVLVDGATGGVGMFACQLARLAGARVVAAIRKSDHEAFVRQLGAEEVAVGERLAGAASFGPYDLILDSVGGDTLAAALELLAPGGVCVLCGASQSPVTTFDASRFRVGATTLYGLFLGDELTRVPAAAGLARLARLVGDGELDPVIGREASWTSIGSVAAELLERRFSGKAVLHIDAR